MRFAAAVLRVRLPVWSGITPFTSILEGRKAPAALPYAARSTTALKIALKRSHEAWLNRAPFRRGFRFPREAGPGL